MLSFNTPQFVSLLIVFIICWYIIPHAFRKPALTLFSFYYACLLGGVWTIIILSAVTILTFSWAFILEKSSNKKLLLTLFLSILILLLIYGKQTAALTGLLSGFINTENISLTVVNMVGLSYYVLSAISYIVDVYRGKDSPDKNFIDIALWLSLFTKIIAGPIERHDRFKQQLDRISDSKFDFERIKRGLLICARGYFYKLVIADRIVYFVDNMFPNAADYHGFILIFTMIAYSLQIYFDFAGYSLIAYGISYAIDLRITNNFELPYFSASIREFWKRWHISLSSWLRDYIYIPLGGSRKGKIRQYLNLFITFIVSGIWHGSGVTFLIWGGLHAAFQTFEQLILDKIKLPKFVRIIITFFAVSFAWIFFRAESFQNAKMFIKRMLTFPSSNMVSWEEFFNLGLGIKDWIVLVISIGIALIAEMIQYNGVSLYDSLQNKNVVIRWICYYLIIVLLVIFGIYGITFDVSNFIYSSF